MADLATQVTDLYVKLEAIDSSLSKLAMKSEINTIQAALMVSLNSLVAQVTTLTDQVQSLESSISNLLTQLRNH